MLCASTYLTIDTFPIPMRWFTVTATTVFHCHICDITKFVQWPMRNLHSYQFTMHLVSSKESWCSCGRIFLKTSNFTIFRAIWSHIGGWFRWLDTATIVRLLTVLPVKPMMSLHIRGFHRVCLSHRELELSPVPGSAEGQSLHIPAEPELCSRVTPVLPPPP